MSRKTIRGLIQLSRECGGPWRIYVDCTVFRCWANGHVRVDGIHRSIKEAQALLEKAQDNAGIDA